MKRRIKKAIKFAQAALLVLMMLISLSSSPAWALDNLNDINCNFVVCPEGPGGPGSPFDGPLDGPDQVDCDPFTGHCTDGGPFDEPRTPEPESSDDGSSSQNSPPPRPIDQSPSDPPDDPLPPICRTKPSLPQCN